jgi:NAD(P)H-hydrate epimerase
MVEVDRLMIEEYGISLVQMMENAGRNLAEQAVRMLAPRPLRECRVLVLCGGGNNGGGGMVAARHLHNRGATVSVALLPTPQTLKAAPAQQWHILQQLEIALLDRLEFDVVHLLIDALIGYGLRGDLRPEAAAWITAANDSGLPILALDTPSGLDTTTGRVGEPCIQATATLTLALPKSGLLVEGARHYVGQLYLADISVPPELYQRLGLQVPPLFAEESILRLD